MLILPSTNTLDSPVRSPNLQSDPRSTFLCLALKECIHELPLRLDLEDSSGLQQGKEEIDAKLTNTHPSWNNQPDG